MSTVTFPISGFPAGQWAEYQWPLAAAEYEREITDSVGIADEATRRALFVRGIAESVGANDTIARRVDYARLLPEQMGMTDVVSRAAEYSRTIIDAMGIEDRLERRAVYVRTVLDAMGMDDSLSWAWTTPDQLQLILELTRRVEAELIVTRQVDLTLER